MAGIWRAAPVIQREPTAPPELTNRDRFQWAEQVAALWEWPLISVSYQIKAATGLLSLQSAGNTTSVVTVTSETLWHILMGVINNGRSDPAQSSCSVSCIFFFPSMLPESPPDSSSEACSPAQMPGTVLHLLRDLHSNVTVCFVRLCWLYHFRYLDVTCWCCLSIFTLKLPDSDVSQTWQPEERQFCGPRRDTATFECHDFRKKVANYIVTS